ncbi:MAG: transcription-repair coupling factor [Oscillospiraceae bacterium]
MQNLRDALLRLEEVAELARAVEAGRCPAAMTGLGPVHRAHVTAAVAARTERPACVIVSDEGEARRMAEDLRTFQGKEPLLLPGRELRFRGAASRDWEQRRMAALYRLATEENLTVVATVESLLYRTIPREVLLQTAAELRLGGRYDLEALAEKLVRAGYVRTQQVEGPGQFALRGGILDVFSPLMEQPVRCEFFGDEVDSMGLFDTGTQRRVKNVKYALVLAAEEVLADFAEGGREGLAAKLEKLAAKYEKKEPGQTRARTLRSDAELLRAGASLPAPDRYAAAVYGGMATAFDYLPPEALVVLSDTPRVLERLRGALLEWKQDMETLLEEGLLAGEFSRLALESGEFTARLADWPVCYLDALPTSRYPAPPKKLLTLMAKQLASYGGSLDTAAADMEQYLRHGTAVQVLCGSEGRARNLQALLRDKGVTAALDFDGQQLPSPGEVRIAIGALSAGMEYPALGLAVLTEGQLLAQGGKKKRAAAGRDDSRRRIQSFTDLTPGDLVVHAHHGVGRFVGIQRMPVDGVEKDYIKIAYAGSDCLYVPATSLDLVSKYIGGGEEPEKTKLSRLGGTDWARATRKAKAAAKDLAKGLIALYAERQRRPGYAFSPDSPWQQEFEASFEYEETDDQLRCIEEIKRDMERPVPMDRLLCGDVGYGKTEVALRAVMKCVLDGKQAAILVPTTVLAQQHYATALHRFRSYPVNVAVLSRFQSPKQSAQILKDLSEGRVDLLIGTHRLLQKGIKFKDLGLLVIDEEQRFGVTHKEKLKELSRQVDVLTLSATPIPRTLNMALSGIRDMSTIEEPPRERQPVQTYVLEHEWPVLLDAIRREIGRGGQVYYLHNRVESIDMTASRLKSMLGEEARVLTAHGKLSEQELSSVMQKMVDGEADVLVCTTIIETGIDIPNVNTLIIEDADRLGLAQLHQIRGRIGRSARRAYAYMTYRPAKILTEVAAKRLAAIREYVEFGSGFKIAMRDLEIRGAGNLLGPEQSGYMMSVGYDMYLQLLQEAVLEEQGEVPKKKLECSADLTVSANIPERYVPSPEQRMDLYRRIAAIRGAADADDVLDELTDRYGEPPKSVLALLDVALLRAAAVEAGVADITQKGDTVLLRLGEVDVQRLAAVCGLAKYRGRLRLLAGEEPGLSLRLKKGEDVLESALALVEDLKLSGG